MPSAGVVFDGVSKKYRRGLRHDSLRDLIPWLIRAPFRRADPAALQEQEFWALRDVSFEAGPGAVLGIIGSNGAGKSTVLKLLTRIIRPTLGRSEVTGRIGALIELAAGFHPDLSGRENVYLQGALMGMSRSDIARKFADIVEFAELGEFIDTPVKRYSSGMNARLGFSIAAHLEPDVLIIDEVLSVGDFSFQDRAFERIRAIARAQVPIIVVSHQLDRIAALCNRVIVLERGAVLKDGRPADAIAEYVRQKQVLPGAADAASPIVIESVELRSAERPRSGERIALEIYGSVTGPADDDLEGVSLKVRGIETGQILFATSTARLGVDLPGDGSFRLAVELQMNVPAGVYWIETSVWDRRLDRDRVAGPAVQVEVDDGPGFWGQVQLNPSIRLDVVPAARVVSASATALLSGSSAG